MKKLIKALFAIFYMGFIILAIACVDQHPEKHGMVVTENGAVIPEDIRPAVALARKKANKKNVRIVATSPAIMAICEKLNLELVGGVESDISYVPERYKDVEKVGTPMSPDMEIVSAIHPDFILSPQSLMSDLKPKYEGAGLDYAFLNLSSVKGMYKSIEELGEIFNRKEDAKALTTEFQEYLASYNESHKGQTRPKVLILMGLPGSYIIATENSYVGSLVEMAGGINVYAGTNDEFLNVNTEDMKLKEPDIILRASHALPDKVKDMFDKDFKENDIWKHFKAVKDGNVYDLSYQCFGMSAKFNYPDALSELDGIFYSNNTD